VSRESGGKRREVGVKSEEKERKVGWSSVVLVKICGEDV
jgi:hypothetical protein